MISHPYVDKIKYTLDLFDANRETIAVGGAAITLAFAEVGLPDIRALDDLDALSPDTYFNRLATNPTALQNIERFKIRWPKQRLLERGSSTLAIDLDPSEAQRQLGALSFTVCVSMSDNFYTMDYNACATRFETSYCGERSINLAEMLRWLAIIGRDKDLDTVKAVIDPAIQTELISPDQAESIYAEYMMSIKDKAIHPEKYYSRT